MPKIPPSSFRCHTAAAFVCAISLLLALASDAAIFVKIPNVPGDAKTDGYDDGSWFVAESGSYGIDRDLAESGKDGTEDINIGVGGLKPIGLAFYLNSAVAPLAQTAINGNPLAEVEIHLTDTANDPDSGEPVHRIFGIIKLTRVFVLRFTTENEADDRPWYQFFFSYNKISHTNRLLNPESGDSYYDYTSTWDLLLNEGNLNVKPSPTTAPTNRPPSISAISPRSTPEDTRLSVPFTVGDPDEPDANLTASATSSNPTLVPNSSLTFSGSTADRILVINPAANQNGNTTITVSVTDSSNVERSTSFPLTVTPTPDPPTIATIDPQVTDTGTPLIVPVFPADPDQPDTSLLLSATSTNQSLLPDANITFALDGTAWQMTLTPVTGQSGAADLTLTVRDNTGTTTDTTVAFTVNTPSNTAPTDILLTPDTIPENSPPDTLVGTLSAVDAQNDTGITFTLLDDDNGHFRLADGNRIFTTSTFDHEEMPNATLFVRATDSQAAVFGKAINIDITNVNEPPEVTLDLPPSIHAARTPAAPSPVPIPYPNIAFSDPDSHATDVTVTLKVFHATLHLDSSGSLAGRVTGNGSRLVTVTAPINDLVQVITGGGFTYTADLDYQGADSLEATIDDLGQPGGQSPLSASASAPFFVRPEPVVEWRQQTFTADQLDDPDISGLTADSDRDNLSTLLEFKLNKDPNDPADPWDNVTLEQIDDGGAPFFQLTFIQRTDASAPNTVLDVEFATDTSTYQSGDTVLRTISRTDLGNGLERITVRPTTSLTETPSQFLRFKAHYLGFLPPR